MPSPQTLSEPDRRLLAAWAAGCAEHVVHLFEADAPEDDRPRVLIARARAYSRGELSTADEIRRRFKGGVPAGMVEGAAAAAARAAGQAAGIAHMGAHALGAAAYAARAAGLANPGQADAIADEIRWQLTQAGPEVQRALRSLPPVGENSAGPLGPGLLGSGEMGAIVRQIQAALANAPPTL